MPSTPRPAPRPSRPRPPRPPPATSSPAAASPPAASLPPRRPRPASTPWSAGWTSPSAGSKRWKTWSSTARPAGRNEPARVGPPELLGGVAAVEDDRLARDTPGAIGGEEGGVVGDLGRVEQAALGDEGEDHLRQHLGLGHAPGAGEVGELAAHER